MDERIIDLETRLLFQERTIEDLHEVVLAQAGELGELRRRLEQVEARGTAPQEDAETGRVEPYGRGPGDGEGSGGV